MAAAILLTYFDNAVRPAPGEERPAADEYDAGWRLGLDRATYSAMLVPFDGQGRADPARLIDSGANLYVDDLAAGRGGEIILGGAIRGQAALFLLQR